jgi:hypothetical protein
MNSIWIDVIQATLFGVAVPAFVIGVLLIAVPERFIRATAGLNRWISTDNFFRDLDRARPTERVIYRYHRAVGLLVAAGGAYVLYVFLFRFDAAKLLPVLPEIYNRAASAWLYESLGWILTLVGVVAVIAGLTIVLRPSLLKSLEEWSNRWIETRSLATRLDRTQDLPAHWYPGKARVFGWIIAIGSLVILYLTAPYVLG